MRPLGVVGAVLIVAGAVVLALRGVSYTKNRQTVQLGPLGVTTEQKGFIPPIIGVVAVVVGGVLMYSARRKG
jgi:drug/metabolite transporter (DMT)-like permease